MKKILMTLFKIVIVVSILIAAIAYMYHRSYYEIDVTNYVFESEKIDKPVHIVMIADVHDHFCKVKSQIIDKIKKLSPDLILCVGDIIDKTSNNDQSAISFLESLVEIAPVYMSYGNQELDYYSLHKDELNHIKKTGVTLLDEEYLDIKVNKQKIRLGGLYRYAFETGNGTITEKWFGDSPVYKFMLDYVNTDSFKLMMAHRPDSFIFGEGGKWNVDLALSGHLHGGQIVIPFIGGLYAPEQGLFPKYINGIYQLDNMQILITRGCSSSNEKLPRLNNPVEIIDLTLQ